MTDEPPYQDWRSLELAIKDAAKKKAQQSGAGIAATVDAQLRQARYNRFLCRVFAEGATSEWLLKGGLSMLARVPRPRPCRSTSSSARRRSVRPR